MGAHVASCIPVDCTELVLYVTGLTPALLATIRYCQHNKILLTTMNYNAKTGEYVPFDPLEFD